MEYYLEQYEMTFFITSDQLSLKSLTAAALMSVWDVFNSLWILMIYLKMVLGCNNNQRTKQNFVYENETHVFKYSVRTTNVNTRQIVQWKKVSKKVT